MYERTFDHINLKTFGTKKTARGFVFFSVKNWRLVEHTGAIGK